MSQISPEGPVYQAGTLSGNSASMAAGLATIQKLKTPALYSQLEEQGRKLSQGLKEIISRLSLPATVNRMGSMMTVFFTPDPVIDWESAARSDTALFRVFFHESLKQGVYLPPSQFEAFFLSTRHDDEVIRVSIEKMSRALIACRNWIDQGRPEYNP
jgi:glutamate-1-semialdehyde 2,1-aminomutase